MMKYVPLTNTMLFPFLLNYYTNWDFYYHGFTLVPAWISDYIRYKVWNETTYPSPNFNGATVEVWD